MGLLPTLPTMAELGELVIPALLIMAKLPEDPKLTKERAGAELIVSANTPKKTTRRIEEICILVD